MPGATYLVPGTVHASTQQTTNQRYGGLSLAKKTPCEQGLPHCTYVLQAEQRLPHATEEKAKRSFPMERGPTAKHHRAWNPQCVGRTHTIVRLKTRMRRKDGTENFGGFVYVLDGFPQRDFVLWGFMCPINIILFCVYSVSILCLFFSPFRLPRRGLPRPIYTARAITPLPPLHGYHACLFPGYHAIVLCSIPGLSHLSYHAPHTYIGLSHPP